MQCATADPDGRPRALLIGGGIANFTDVAKTFSGIIRAIREKVRNAQCICLVYPKIFSCRALCCKSAVPHPPSTLHPSDLHVEEGVCFGISKGCRYVSQERQLRDARFRLFVRRGGPNYQKGLDMMRNLGKELNLPIQVGEQRLGDTGGTDVVCHELLVSVCRCMAQMRV